MDKLIEFAERCLSYLECNEDGGEDAVLLIQGYCALAKATDSTPIQVCQDRRGKRCPMPSVSYHPGDIAKFSNIIGEFEWGTALALDVKKLGGEAVSIVIRNHGDDEFWIEAEIANQESSRRFEAIYCDEGYEVLAADIIQMAIEWEGLKVFRDRAEWEAYCAAEPKFAVGDFVYVQSRYDGILKRTVTGVFHPDGDGFAYELDWRVQVNKDGFTVGKAAGQSISNWDGDSPRTALAPEDYLMRLGDRIYNTHPISGGLTDVILTEDQTSQG